MKGIRRLATKSAMILAGVALMILIPAFGLYAEEAVEMENDKNKEMAPVADSEVAETSEAAHSWISSGKELGSWWNKRARKQDPLPPELLYHLEMSYSYSKLTGDNEGKRHKADTNLKLRKYLITSTTSFSLKDYTISYGGLPPDKTDKKVFEQTVFYEAFQKTDLFCGFQWKSDNKRLIDDRYMYSVGLYRELLSSPFRLRAGAAYGYADIFYDEGIPDYHTDLAAFFTDLTWPISEQINFTGTGFYFQYLKDTDFKFWGIYAKLSYKLMDHVSIYTSYQVDYEQDKIDETHPGVEKENTELDIGITLSF